MSKRIDAVTNLNFTEYNTVSGISAHLDTLGKLRMVLDERRAAYYQRKERLQSFILLGRYLLDSCGNVGFATEFIPAEKIEDFPLIVTTEEGNEIISEYDKKLHPDVLSREEINADDFDWSANKRPFPISVTYGMKDTIPSAEVVCAHCGEHWRVDNCHDILTESGDEVMSGKPYIGETLEEVRKILGANHDIEYRIYSERPIRNDKYIDTTPDEKYPDCQKNEKGWIKVEASHVVEEGDEIYVHWWRHYHKSCKVEVAKLRCAEIYQGKEEYHGLRNLAGCHECDPWIVMELSAAGIHVIESKADRGEVPYRFEGRLGASDQFVFTRAWRYWVVSGKVPLPIARTMYADEEGKKYVRVSGHCGCPPPDDWADHYSDDGKLLASTKELEDYPEDKREEIIQKTAEKIEWVDDPKKGTGYVGTYHIDTFQGLKLFAESVKSIVEGEPEFSERVAEWLSK